MNRTDAPKKQPVAFGVNGQRENLPDTTPSGDNTASYDVGFPPVTMILKSAGGLPPKGQDINQILYELSNLGKWASSGALNAFDSAFASAIGGYPSGAMVISNDGATIFISTSDANTNDPNTTTTGWKSLLNFLGLGGVSSGMFPIGMPFYWPSATMPNLLLPEWSGMTFLKWNGATFSATAYPKLALIIPSLTLTESRGEFIRNWDDGRGIDSGRTLLSSQTDATQRVQGSLSNVVYSATEAPANITGPFSGIGGTTGLVNGSSPTGSLRYIAVSYDNNLVARTASENRSRNIAFNFLVRAA